MNNTFLLNDFYTVDKIEHQDNMVKATVSLNAAHSIFKGHFEQMPVVPGVCQTQIIKELLETQMNKTLLMTKGDNIKFMGMIVPQQHPKVNVEISYSLAETTLKTDAKLYHENTTFTKFKGEFVII